MDSKIILGKILQKFCDMKVSQVNGYNRFCYIRETNNAIYVTREKGKDTKIPFKKILIAIDAYKENPSSYDFGPNELRSFGITHLNSPIWSLLHLLPVENYSRVKE